MARFGKRPRALSDRLTPSPGPAGTKGLVNSRVGIVLVTPAMLRRLPAEGIADKELSALLRRERLVPVVHGTTYDELEQVSLLLASRAGLNTAEESMEEVATKIAELVAT